MRTARNCSVVLLVVSLASVLSGLSACGDGTGPGEESLIRGVTVSPSSATVDSGDTRTFTASVDAEAGSNTDVNWRSSDPSTAAFESRGSQSATVFGASPGQATITAVSVADTTESGSATLTVERVPPVTSVDVFPSDTTVEKGRTVQLTATVETGRPGVSDRVTWRSRDTVVATVDSTGLVTGREQGEASILATAVADTTVSDSATVTVTAEATSVTIRSLTRAGTDEDLPIDSLHGSVDVHFTLDLDDSDVGAIRLLVDSTTVDSVPGSSIPASGVLEDTLTVHTASVDSAAPGHVRYRNGSYRLEVRALDGDSVRASAEEAVEFRNEDTFAGEVTFDGTRADDAGGRDWFGGDVSVSVLPLIYTPDREIGSVELFFPDATVVDSTPDEDDAFGATFRNAPDAGHSIDGVVDTAAFARVKESTTADGETGPGPVDVGDTVRLDNRAPDVNGWSVIDWVNASDSTSSTVNRISDRGVTRRDTAYRLDGAPFEAATFAAAEDADSVEWVITSTDAVANTGADTIYFGVDATPPSVAFTDSSVADREIFDSGNPDDHFAVSAEDTLSGLDGSVRVNLVRRLPGLSEGDGCVVGDFDGECEPEESGDSVEVDQGADGEPGYFRYAGHAVDSAGNRSVTVRREVLVDDEAPSVTEVDLPSQFEGGDSIVADATLEDSVDLWKFERQLRWRNRDPLDDAGALSGHDPRLQFGTAADIDPAFDDNLVGEETVQADIPHFYRQLQQVDDAQVSDGDIEASAGVKPDRFWVNAFDAARNEGDTAAIVNDVHVEDGTDFTDQLVYFRMTEPDRDLTIDVDGERRGQFPEVVILEAEVVMDETGDVVPFDRVDFYVRVSEGSGTLLQIGTATSVVTDRTEDVDSDPGRERIVRFETVWDPTPEQMRLLAGNKPESPLPARATAPNLYAAGIDAEGDALLTNDAATDDEGNDGDTGDVVLTLRK